MRACLLLPAALCAAVLAACAAVAPAVPGAPLRGDALAQAGDWEGAALAYEQEMRAGADSAVLREKLLNARRLAARDHAAAAVRAADAGDVARARDELRRAEELGKDVPAVRRAREALAVTLAATECAAGLRDSARAELETDPEEAERLLAEARNAAPDGSALAADVARLHREASLRAEAARAAARAAEAWQAGDRERAAREVAVAEFAGSPVPAAEALRRRMAETLLAEAAPADVEALRTALRLAGAARLGARISSRLHDALVERLLAQAKDLAGRGRTVVAALLESEARAMRGDAPTPALDAVRERAAVVVGVEAFEAARDGLAGGAQIARALRDRLAADARGGGLVLRVTDHDDAVVPPAAGARPPRLRLSGKVLAEQVTEGRVGRENRKVRWQSGTRLEPNPRFDEALARLAAAQADLTAAQDELTDAQTWLNKLNGLPFVRAPSGPPVRFGDAYHQSQVAAAEARVERAARDLRRARDTEFAVRQEVQVTPREVEEPVFSEESVPVTFRLKTAKVTAHLVLDGAGGPLLSEDVTASADHRETVSEGLPEAGLAPDPDEMPDDAEMASRAADRLAALAAGRVRTAAEKAALCFLDDARRAEESGDRDGAAESYALYLLATRDTGSAARAEAARAVLALAGVRVPQRPGVHERRP